jgi:Protein of unknown function (DUF3025)
VEIAELANVDWSAPWLTPVAGLGRTVAASADWRKSLSRAAAAANVRNSNGQRITFSEAGAATDEPYEAFIARTGCVPTRANLHDFFNALVFLHFPRAKLQLNRLQAAAIARDGIGAVRGPIRDAATLIDENAVLVVTDRSDVVDSLRGHDWWGLFQGRRLAWAGEVSVLAFGHALLHKLQRPYKGITAHALHIGLAPGSSLDQIDRCMAAGLDERLTPHDLMPLPVLGIPGWCAQNENPDFYSDPAVFRPAKMRPDCKAETDS